MPKSRAKKQTKRDVLREEALARRKTEERVEAPRWAYLVIGVCFLGFVLLVLFLMSIGVFLPE